MSKNFNRNKNSDFKSKKGNNNNSRKGSNENRPLDREAKIDSAMISAQEPFWYAKDEKAIANMATFPWNDIVGDKYPGVTRGTTSNDRTPAIVTYPVWHCIGSRDVTRNNYLTRAADTYYQYVTQGFTGAVDFEAPDLLFTALAGESLLALLIEGKRAYGLMKYYLQYNKYYARTIVRALGFDFDDLNKKMAEFRTQYNIRVAQINKLIAIPKSFFIGDRWEYLSSWVFTDTDSPEYSTAYAYVIQACLKYEATAINTGTSLSWVNKSSDFFTVTSFFTFLDSLINALTDSDARDIYGAIRRVYNPSDLKVVSELEEDFTTTVVRNDVIAMAIHNTVTLQRFDSSVTATNDATKFLPITQSPEGAIVSNVYGNYVGGSAAMGSKTLKFNFEPKEFILDMYDHAVTPGNILDATVNMTVLDFTDQRISGNTILNRAICRSELIATPQIHFINDLGVEVTFNAPLFLSTSDYSFTADSAGETWSGDGVDDEIAMFSHLDSHTLMRILETPAEISKEIGETMDLVNYFNSINVKAYLGEIDRYTGLSLTDLAKMHEVSQYQLLSMPDNSKSVTK